MTAIRRMTAGDLEAGLRLCRLSRWNQLAEDWLCFLDPDTGGAWLAEKDGTAAGTVAVLRYPPNFAWLSMMLVDPAHRGSGIGSQLMEVALSFLADEPCIRLDATPSGETLYRRFGFVDEYPLARATASSLQLTPSAGVRAIGTGDLPSIFRQDRVVFGADRSAVLESLYRRAPHLAVAGPDGAYCLGRPGYLYHQIGPIVAGSLEAAAGLLTRCHCTGPVAIDVPRHSPQWIRWLGSAGFTVERHFLRMRRGVNPDPGQPQRQFAIAGPEFG